jgi:AmmeMemoRadiSam system protein A
MTRLGMETGFRAASAVMVAIMLLFPASCRAGKNDNPNQAQKESKGSKAMETKEAAAKTVDYTMTEADKKECLKIARNTVETYVKTGKKPEFKPSPKLQEMGAVFVTLKKHGELRGCIGDIVAHQPLFESIVGNAVNAAIHDPRFEPVQPRELPEIDIEISVLTPMQPVSDVKEIVIGRDGLMLTKGWNRGVFLPQVPVEWKWDLNQYLDNLCGKAGLRAGCWKDAKLEKFQAIVFGEKQE